MKNYILFRTFSNLADSIVDVQCSTVNISYGMAWWLSGSAPDC
jgi:hypothetical protein